LRGGASGEVMRGMAVPSVERMPAPTMEPGRVQVNAHCRRLRCPGDDPEDWNAEYK
jgi:hypothetical protein